MFSTLFRPTGIHIVVRNGLVTSAFLRLFVCPIFFFSNINAVVIN